MDSMYLENLDEFINDEGKIVTYKWLSLSLKVHTNVAKQMLYHYVSKQRNTDKGDDLNVTYIVSGVATGEDKQRDMLKTMLVREENLATAKNKMKDVISVHIYSVAKSKVKDLNALYTANYDEVKKNLVNINRYSGIECSSAKVKSADDLKRLQQQNAYQAPAEPAPLQKKAPQVKTDIKNEPGKEEGNAGKESSVNKQGKKTNNQIASMFARQSVKAEVKEEKKEKETNKPSSAGSKKKEGISAFFNKGGATTTKVQTPDSSKSSPIKTELVEDSTSSESPKLLGTESEATSSPGMTESLLSSSIKTESQDSQTDSVEVDLTSPKKSKTEAKAKTQSKIKPGKPNQKRGKPKKSNDESPIPKRRRIMAMSDSDSSSDEEKEEESPFPASPAPEAARIESDDEEIPSTPQPEPKEEQLSSNGRPKKRKLVSKTFMDDDGFFVTKKEYEYVSDLEEEVAQSNQENIPSKVNANSPSKKIGSSPKKNADKSPQKKASKPSPKKASKDVNKTKQSSIMSFFNKK